MTDQDRDFGAGVPGMIAQACYELRDFLHEKNRKYGNSALDPVRILSKASPVEQILVRIDDKLSRLRSGQTDDTEDVEWDLLGYLLLLRVARKHVGPALYPRPFDPGGSPTVGQSQAFDAGAPTTARANKAEELQYLEDKKRLGSSCADLKALESAAASTHPPVTAWYRALSTEAQERYDACTKAGTASLCATQSRDKDAALGAPPTTASLKPAQLEPRYHPAPNRSTFTAPPSPMLYPNLSSFLRSVIVRRLASPGEPCEAAS